MDEWHSRGDFPPPEDWLCTWGLVIPLCPPITERSEWLRETNKPGNNEAKSRAHGDKKFMLGGKRSGGLRARAPTPAKLPTVKRN